ncbi:MAG: DUF748 domain-containing protein [Candidatus Omnitrophica bacterium]|nr:DUF748 domain-containing protein [Candidatus Omnitrophota bacterium]
MLQKILRIFLKTILGIFLFYTITGFIVIPLVLTWAISNQGTKLLKHPVHIHSVGLNPFLLQLTLNNFEILDNTNQVMAGFDKLFVKMSPVDLFKKIYHVETFELDGLRVNVELLPGNKINLLELVPQAAAQPAKGPKQSTAGINKPVLLPEVIIDSIVLRQGQVHFTDKTIKPDFSTILGAMELHVTNVTTNPEDQAKIKFQANLDDKGKITMETIIKLLSHPLEMETTFSLNGYALGILTPYVGKYTGRELRSGKLDLTMEYRIGANKLVASHRVLIQRFEFGNSVESKDALHLPFGLAVALLEDPQGKIKIALPASGDMSDPKFEYTHLIFQVIRNFFLNLVTKPFSFLASALGGSDSSTDELGYVRFAPGKSVITVNQQQKLVTLIKGIAEHPKLRLEINGSYDPQVDWKAIQADVFTKDYEKLRKESRRSDSKVYQLLYQRRYGIRGLWALAKKYKQGVGRYKDTKFDEEIKRQLIENAPPDQEALSALAQDRARLVHEFLVNHGFDAQRLSIGQPQSTQSSMGYVPLQFTLTVFDK